MVPDRLYKLPMRKKRLIPFRWLPGSWGLAGPAYQEAEAYYYYDGYDLDVRLAEIRCENTKELDAKILDLQFEHGIIDEVEYDLKLAEMREEGLDKEIAILEAKARAGEIDPFEAEKEIATLKGEPWIRVIDDGINHALGVDGYYFEFDWNSYWIEALREAGYMGRTDDAIVQAWFQDVCRQEASASLGAPPINGGIITG